MESHVLRAAWPCVRRAPESAKAAHLRIGHHLREGRADGCVEGIASAREELGADLCCQRLRCDNHPFHLLGS